MGRSAGPVPPTIVFDLDGTLVDTAEDLIGALNAIAVPRGLALFTLVEGRNLVGGGARLMIERGFAARGRPLGRGDSDALLAEFLAHYRLHMVDNSRPYPGTAAALDRFRAADWRLAVCTNKLEAFARELLVQLGLADRFAAITGQDTFGVRKPDPRHLIETIRLAGGDPAHAVMIGDSITDFATARAAAVPVVAMSYGYSDRPVADLGANRVIREMAELWDAVAGLGIAPPLHSRRVGDAL